MTNFLNFNRHNTFSDPRLLKEHGFLSLTKDFRSVYVFSLIEYAERCDPKELVELFANENVIDAFRNELYKKKNAPSFKKMLEAVLHTCKDDSFISLKKTFKASGLKKEVGIFKEIFQQKTKESKNPAGICSDDKLNEILRILKEFTKDPLDIPYHITAKMPITRAQDIIGREAELLELRQRLVDRKQVVLMNGLGGIGKTTLAQAYVGRFQGEYRHLAWIGQTSKSLMADFVQTEGLMDALKVEAGDKDYKTLFPKIIQVLKGISDQPNLLILDNADAGLEEIFDYLPGYPNWHVLATSREEIEGLDSMELGFLSEDNAIKLFYKHYKKDRVDQEAVREFIKSVELHTLTIEILAKVADLHRTMPENLLKAIRENIKANVKVPHCTIKIERVTSYLCEVFEMSALEENEIWLLKQFVCLPSEFHSFDLLEDLINPAATDRDDIFSKSLEGLRKKGWLLYLPSQDAYKMHRIVREVILRQKTIGINDVEALVKTFATDKFSLDPTIDNPADKFKWIVYGFSMLEVFPDCPDEMVSVLQNNFGLRLREFGDYKGAKALLEKAMASDEKHFGPDHPTTAVRYSNLALVLQDLGEYETAESLAKKTLDVFLRVFPEDHPYIAQATKIYEQTKEWNQGNND